MARPTATQRFAWPRPSRASRMGSHAFTPLGVTEARRCAHELGMPAPHVRPTLGGKECLRSESLLSATPLAPTHMAACIHLRPRRGHPLAREFVPHRGHVTAIRSTQSPSRTHKKQ